jgi:hypothetical protein
MCKDYSVVMYAYSNDWRETYKQAKARYQRMPKNWMCSEPFLNGIVRHTIFMLS